MKAFVLAALVAAAYAQPPGSIDQTNQDLVTDENATTGTTDAGTADVPDEEVNLDDYQITEATDFYDNREAKKDFVDFDWDKYNMQSFTFGDLMDLLNSDDHTEQLAAQVKDSFKVYYESQTDKLPDVCEGGKECRRKVKEAAMAAIKVEWELTLGMIKSEITQTLFMSRQELETSYQQAYFCNHGCECQFIENRYSLIKADIEDLEGKIADNEAKIQATLDKIAGAELHPCDFSTIREKYEDEWDVLAADHEKQVAALADWKNDGFEMEDLVDQDKFFDTYGFKYDSSHFDIYDGANKVVLE